MRRPLAARTSRCSSPCSSDRALVDGYGHVRAPPMPHCPLAQRAGPPLRRPHHADGHSPDPTVAYEHAEEQRPRTAHIAMTGCFTQNLLRCGGGKEHAPRQRRRGPRFSRSCRSERLFGNETAASLHQVQNTGTPPRRIASIATRSRRSRAPRREKPEILPSPRLASLLRRGRSRKKRSPHDPDGTTARTRTHDRRHGDPPLLNGVLHARERLGRGPRQRERGALDLLQSTSTSTPTTARSTGAPSPS